LAPVRLVARHSLFWSVIVIGVFLVAELGLRVVGALSPRVAYVLRAPWDRATVRDSVLGFRMSPFLPDIDSWGYRNPPSHRPSPVLALGDSYTYGFGAPADSSWPRQLEHVLGVSVYNGGIGGYGPCEYEKILDELIVVRPRLVLLGLYVGNDLSDAYRSSYEAGRCSARRSDNPVMRRALLRLDSMKTLQARAIELGWEAPQARKSSVEEDNALRSAFVNLRLYGLLRALWYEVHLSQANAEPGSDFSRAASKPGWIAYAGPRAARTVFKRPEIFALTVDQTDPRIREGMRMLVDVISDMHQRLKGDSIDFVVVVIVDKAVIYRPVLQVEGDDLQRRIAARADLEMAINARLDSLLREAGVPVVNTTQALQVRLKKGAALFREDDDHHNNGLGYKAVSDTVKAFLVQRGWP